MTIHSSSQSSFVGTLLGFDPTREPVALATVVSGPSAGREAVVWLDKPPLGDLGLGDLEPQVIADAQEVLRGRQHKLLRYPRLIATRRFHASTLLRLRRSPAPLARAADRRRGAHRGASGADGEHV